MAKLRNFAHPIPFSVHYLKECVHYYPQTGEFRWKKRPAHHFCKSRTLKSFNTQFAGSVAGTVGDGGYRLIGISYQGRSDWWYAHRLAWLYMTEEDANFQIDHIDGDKDNNRWNNLRRGDGINLRNKALHKNNTSGVNGITWRKDNQKWRARLAIDMPDGSTKRITVANTPDFDEAAQALQKAYKEYGYDVSHGKPRNPFN